MSKQRTVYGRDEFCDEIIRNAFKDGALLLFGAQKSGRMTILRLGAERWANAAAPGIIRLPVIVDLRDAPKLVSDEVLCKYIAQQTREAYKQRTNKPLAAAIPHDPDATACTWLFKHFEGISQEHPDAEILLIVHRVDYLLADETFDQFFRNLHNAVLKPDRSAPIAVILSGGTKLHHVCAYKTSSIASISLRKCVENLGLEPVKQWIRAECGPGFVGWAEYVHEQTGGQPWLVAKMLSALKEVPEECECDADASEKLRVLIESQVDTQVQNWLKEFNPDASAIISFLQDQKGIIQSEVATQLGFDDLKDKRINHAMMECVCAGIVNFGHDQRSLIKVNLLFWSVVRGNKQHVTELVSGKDCSPNSAVTGNLVFDWVRGALSRGNDSWDVPPEWTSVFRLLFLPVGKHVVAKAPRNLVCAAWLLCKRDKEKRPVENQLTTLATLISKSTFENVVGNKTRDFIKRLNRRTREQAGWIFTDAESIQGKMLLTHVQTSPNGAYKLNPLFFGECPLVLQHIDGEGLALFIKELKAAFSGLEELIDSHTVDSTSGGIGVSEKLLVAEIFAESLGIRQYTK
jgi:hypothetical protein